MSMPFYVAPEQQMKDRADYARKGIARPLCGRPVFRGRHLVSGQNRSQALHKVRRSTIALLSRPSVATTSSRICGNSASGTQTYAATAMTEPT